MQKLYKRLVSLMIAVFVISSVPIIASASEAVTSGSVNNHYASHTADYSYTWEYYVNDTIVIKPSTEDVYINVNDLTDYMKTRFTSNTKITIDCSSEKILTIYGIDCPSGNLTFIGKDLARIELYNFHPLNYVNIDVDFTPSEYGNCVDVMLNSCGITTVDIFEGEGYSLNLELYYCYNLTTLDVPAYVEYLWIFGCDNLETIQANYYLVYLQTFYLSSLKSMYVYGDLYWGLSVKDSPNLETLEVTGDVWRISLINVKLSDVTIPNNVKFFITSDSLTSATIEPGRTIINYGMFEDCPNLTDVTIPDGVTNIYGRAFGNCSSLKSIEIPSSVNFLCDNAFEGCDSLTDVYFPDNCELWESIDVRYGEDSSQPSKKSIYEIFGNATLHFPDPEIITQPEDYAGPSGSNAEFSVEADGSKLKYQWQVLKNGVWTNCSINDGAKTDTLSMEIKDSRDGSKYHCVITDKFGKTVTSKEVTLTVATPLAITSQPEDYSGSVGETATFTVAAQGSGLKYQWQTLKNGSWTNCSVNDGAKTATLSLAIKDSRNGSKYQCVITDKNGETVTTKEVTLTVASALNIETQPEDYSGAAGEMATFTVVAEGSGLKYQWQTLKNGAWTNCSVNDGAKTDTLSLEIKSSRDGSIYHCVITDKNGASLTTEAVTLSMLKGVKIKTNPLDYYGKVKTMATFTVVAEGEGLKYQWQVLKDGVWTNCSVNDGAKTNTLTLEIKDSRNGCEYHCVVTDKYGNTAISSSASIIVDQTIDLPFVPATALDSTEPVAPAASYDSDEVDEYENVVDEEVIDIVTEIQTETVTEVD